MYQLKGKFVGTAFESELTTTDCYIFIDLASDRSAKFKNIAERINLDKSAVSRRVVALEDRGLIRTQTLAADERRKEYEITDKGNEFLELYERRSAEILTAFASRITRAELTKLETYFRRLADGGSVPESIVYPGENPLFTQARRLPGLFGNFKKSFADSGYSHTEWHILSILYYAATPVRAIDICNLLLLNANTVSQIIARHERMGNLERQRLESDKRNVLITLCKPGRKVLRDIEQCIVRILKKSLTKFTVEELTDFSRILLAFVGLDEQRSQPGSTTPLVILRVTGEEERQRHRAFLVTELVHANQQESLSETVLGSSSLSFGLHRGNELVGVCELHSKESIWQLAHFVCAVSVRSSSVPQFFLSRTLEEALRANQRSGGVTVPEAILRRLNVASFPGSIRKDGSRLLTAHDLTELALQTHSFSIE